MNNAEVFDSRQNRNLVPVFVIYGNCPNLERDTSPDPYFFFSGTEKEKYKDQGMKPLAGFGAEPRKKISKNIEISEIKIKNLPY